MGLRSSVSTWLSAAWTSVGGLFGGGSGYTATDPRRKVLPLGHRPGNSTANQVLTASLSGLRAYSRNLERNNPTARAGVEGLVANVVGTGIALEPDTGDKTTDDLIRAEWNALIDSCDVCGRRTFYALQGEAFRDIVVAGEFLWRIVVDPARIKEGLSPIAILPLEAEWLDETANTSGRPGEDGLTWIGGVGIDGYGRARKYRIRHPEYAGGDYEILSDKELIHDFERRRSLQARGEPWFAPIIETLQQERDLVDTELAGAKVTASIGLVITSQAHGALDTTEDGDDEDPAQSLRLGGVSRMYPGEDVKAFAHTRPSQQIAPFRQMLRGDIAASLRLPQRFLDRDVSRANYSSMRADMLDSERLLAPVREWFGHATAGRLYKMALPYLALRAGVKLPRANYKLLPDGQPYVDPYKDIQGAAMGIATGLTTWETEIAKRGGDYRAVWAQAKRERDEAKKLGLYFDLSGTNAPAPDTTIGAEGPQQVAAEGGKEIIAHE
jgi:lambda family phage portal protein